MKEQLHRPPIYFTLAPHATDDVSLLATRRHFDGVIDYMDNNPSATTLLVIEDCRQTIANVPKILADTKAGVPFTRSFMLHRQTTSPTVEATNQEQEERFPDDELEIGAKLDLIIARYDAGRVSVLTEGSDDFGINKSVNPILEQYGKSLYRIFNGGDLTDALEEFKLATTYSADLIQRRDPEMAIQISQAIREGNIDAVFVLFGTAHTLMSLKLGREGYEVIRHFAEKRDGNQNYFFSPFETLTRKLYFFPKIDLEEVEWKRWFIGDLISCYLFNSDGEKQTIEELSLKLISTLTTDDITKLYKVLEKDGFAGLLSSLLESDHI